VGVGHGHAHAEQSRIGGVRAEQPVSGLQVEPELGQQSVAEVGGRVISIEGDPQSPISRGHLCPKGANSYELVTHQGRATTVKYRAPHARAWTEISLELAMQMVADRVWETRERTFNDQVMHTTGMAHLGGATLDNEENYLIKKLFTAGLGMVCVSNQARI